jgi:hypothetical protein
MVAAILERWHGDAWRREAEDWIQDAVRQADARPTGATRLVHVRFWSVVVEVPTDRGALWFKECHPGQGFEPALLAVLAELEPQHFPSPVAIDRGSHRVLLPDLGPDHTHASTRHAQQSLAEMARVQQRLAAHGDRLTAAGLPTMSPTEAPGYVSALARRLHELPASHAQHLTSTDLGLIDSRHGDVVSWSGRLTASGLPMTMQHHDVSPTNSFGESGQPTRWIDVGDAFWTHPFSVLQVPLAMRTGSWPWGPDGRDPLAKSLADAYLDAWTDDGTVTGLRELPEPARRLAVLQRCESWRRLLDDGGSLPDDPTLPSLPEHLVAATGGPAGRSANGRP